MSEGGLSHLLNQIPNLELKEEESLNVKPPPL